MALHKKCSFPIKDFFSKCNQIRSFLQISSHLLKKSLMENFIFCAFFVLRKKIYQVVMYKFNVSLKVDPYTSRVFTEQHFTYSLVLTKCEKISQREKYPYSALFWSVFSRIRTEYGEILVIFYLFICFFEVMYLSTEFSKNIMMQ